VRRVAWSFAALVALAVGGALLTGLRRDTRDVGAERRTVVSPAPGATTIEQVSGVDVSAARQAAVNAVALTDEVVEAGFISRRELVKSFATSNFAPVLADETSAQVTAMLVELGERDADPQKLRLVEQPLSARATAVDDVVRVDVWSVLVIAVPGAGPARQAWRTVTVDMVLVNGRWLVADWQSRPGPTPAPAAEAAFDDASVVVDQLAWEPASITGGVR
jgi:hypothetical protein